MPSQVIKRKKIVTQIRFTLYARERRDEIGVLWVRTPNVIRLVFFKSRTICIWNFSFLIPQKKKNIQLDFSYDSH